MATGRAGRAGAVQPDARWAALVTALAAAGAVVGRLALSGAPLKADEAGYLLVARSAHPGGHYLYGDLWVDRPPLLIAAYRLADDLGGLATLRALAVVAVVVLVAAAGSAGWTVGGLRGSVLGALVAAAFGTTPLFSAPEVDGEILAVPFVMAAVAVGLRAQLAGREAPTRWRPLAASAVAGLLGACAVLVKQNFTDALVVLAVLAVLRAVRHQATVRDAAAHVAALVAGALVPLVAVLAWAAAWHGGLSTGVADLWQPLVSFRSRSFSVILSQHLGAPLHRAHELYWIAMASGMFVVLTVFCIAALASLRRLDPLPVAVLAMVLAGQPAIALGGSFWAHYLVELVPASVLAVAQLSTRGEPWGSLASLLTAVALLSTLIEVPRALPSSAPTSCSSDKALATAEWLRRASHPGDSLLTLYSGAAILEQSGLAPDYPYQWSLPLRTLDPDLALLSARMSGPRAATWAVRTLPLHSWDLSGAGAVSQALRTDYRQVSTVCGFDVYLRDGATRSLPPEPAAAPSG